MRKKIKCLSLGSGRYVVVARRLFRVKYYCFNSLQELLRSPFARQIVVNDIIAL